MKAEITKNGLLKITAETELEKYALSKWLDDNEQAAFANQLFGLTPTFMQPSAK